ncbi:MAG: CRISPR-associated endoribonuclease Cas6 [candidate division WOR-3 bacterium]
MRLKIIFGERGDPFNISRDYRRYFISFIKKVFEKSGKFDEFYSSKRLKPFAFSVFLGNQFELIEESEDEKIKVNPPFNMIFSTGDFEIFSIFYNGLLDIKKENSGITLKNKIFQIKDISLNKIVKINEDSAVFKTVGICILTDPEENSENFDKWFIVPSEKNIEKFNQVLEKRMLKKYEMINQKKIETKIELIPLKGESIKEIYVKHYGGYLKGFKGVFTLKSDPCMLQFIYDYGLGVRTGQGFGLLEIVK